MNFEENMRKSVVLAKQVKRCLHHEACDLNSDAQELAELVLEMHDYLTRIRDLLRSGRVQ